MEGMPVVGPGLPEELGLLLETEAGCRGDQLAGGWVQREKSKVMVCALLPSDFSQQCLPCALRTGQAGRKTYGDSYSMRHCLAKTCLF